MTYPEVLHQPPLFFFSDPVPELQSADSCRLTYIVLEADLNSFESQLVKVQSQKQD